MSCYLCAWLTGLSVGFQQLVLSFACVFVCDANSMLFVIPLLMVFVVPFLLLLPVLPWFVDSFLAFALVVYLFVCRVKKILLVCQHSDSRTSSRTSSRITLRLCQLAQIVQMLIRHPRRVASQISCRIQPRVGCLSGQQLESKVYSYLQLGLMRLQLIFSWWLITAV